MEDLITLEQICGLTDRNLVDAELNRTRQREEDVLVEIEQLTKLIEHALAANTNVELPDAGCISAESTFCTRLGVFTIAE
jgi:hypothetical protein